jgi:hypothetical protein
MPRAALLTVPQFHEFQKSGKLPDDVKFLACDDRTVPLDQEAFEKEANALLEKSGAASATLALAETEERLGGIVPTRRGTFVDLAPANEDKPIVESSTLRDLTEPEMTKLANRAIEVANIEYQLFASNPNGGLRSLAMMLINATAQLPKPGQPGNEEGEATIGVLMDALKASWITGYGAACSEITIGKIRLRPMRNIRFRGEAIIF